MLTRAELNYLRIAPRKVRLVADLIRGKSVEKAQTILNFTNKRAALPLLKLLKSAITNAKNQFQESEQNLYISKITVDEGPKLKRWMPRARGQTYEIQKKTSHITLILDTIKPAEVKKVEKANRSEMKEKLSKTEKPKFKKRAQEKIPTTTKAIKRIFRRKSFRI